MRVVCADEAVYSDLKSILFGYAEILGESGEQGLCLFVESDYWCHEEDARSASALSTLSDFCVLFTDSPGDKSAEIGLWTNGRMARNQWWPRHPNKDIEEVLVELDGQKWRITRGRKYYQVPCPCGLHRKVIHMTPSSRNYVLRLRTVLDSRTCFVWRGPWS